MQTPPNPNTVKSTNVKPKQIWKRRGRYAKRAPAGWRKLKANELLSEGDKIWDRDQHKFIAMDPSFDVGYFASEYFFVIRKK